MSTKNWKNSPFGQSPKQKNKQTPNYYVIGQQPDTSQQPDSRRIVINRRSTIRRTDSNQSDKNHQLPIQQPTVMNHNGSELPLFNIPSQSYIQPHQYLLVQTTPPPPPQIMDQSYKLVNITETPPPSRKPENKPSFTFTDEGINKCYKIVCFSSLCDHINCKYCEPPTNISYPLSINTPRINIRGEFSCKKDVSRSIETKRVNVKYVLVDYLGKNYAFIVCHHKYCKFGDKCRKFHNRINEPDNIELDSDEQDSDEPFSVEPIEQ